MRKLLEKLDELAGIETENFLAKWLERASFVFLVLMFLAAPHSIAATQTAWIAGMIFWLLPFVLKARPRFFRTPLDIALWAFFGWSVVSSVFSYAPEISIDKLRGAAVFLIFYFVVNNVRNFRAVKFLGLAIIFSCLVNAVWMPVQRIIGRGVEIHGISAESPLAKALLYEGDALLKANNVKLKTPEDLIAQIEQSEITKVKFYRPDFEYVVEVKRENLLNGESAMQKLGIESWKKSHNWRSSGFYGHYTTYAEVLQLIASLAFGLLIASFFRENKNEKRKSPFLPFSLSPFLLFACSTLTFALLLTVTRASQLALIVSVLAMVFLVRRKMLLIVSAIVLPVAIGGLFFLQQSRNVGFFDPKDESTRYRQTMYRDGLQIWTQSPRNFVFGVGMDSIQKHWREWGMFEGGRLPLGHFHSTPLQLLVERGLPALLLWLWILYLFARTFLRYLSKFNNKKSALRISHSAIVIGAFGALVGFFTSGLVHYNLGDQEVAMVFFMIMALGVWISSFQTENSDSEDFQETGEQLQSGN